MENLPILVLKKIYSELTNLNEVVRCSSVCRNWRTAYEVCKPTTLCLYSEFMPLNHRLAYSTERVSRCQCFEIREDGLQFLASEITRTHFANIRKLIIFPPIREESNLKYHSFSFEKQLNHFQKLEHLEFQRGVRFDLEDSELDLPILKVLCFNADRKQKEFDDEEYDEGSSEQFDEESGEEVTVTPKVVLNTPSLEILELQPFNRSVSFSEFLLKHPNQLRSLTALLDYDGFKPKTKFERLKCLAVRIDELKDNFLSFFPNLKLLLFLSTWDPDHSLHRRLMEQKKRFRLDDLEILKKHKEDRDLNYCLDHENWRKYVRHEETVQYCPVDLAVDFNKLVHHALPLDLFKSFFRLRGLKVGRVADQSLLLDFLRIAKTFHFLNFTPEFNLDVDFLDQVARFLTVHLLHFTENVLRRLSDYTFLEKFNYSILFLRFRVSQKNLPREAASVALRKPNGHIDFEFDREPPNENGQYVGWGHYIEKDSALGFVCQLCKWSSANDPDSDPIEATIRHAEKRWFFPVEMGVGNQEPLDMNFEQLLDIDLLDIDLELLDI